MPRLRYTLSVEDQQHVRELATFGVSPEDIAAQLRLPLPKFLKIFQHELREGAAYGRTQALRKFHGIATSGDNAAALTFWIKSQCGWRDTGAQQGASRVIRECLVIGPPPSGRAKPSL